MTLKLLLILTIILATPYTFAAGIEEGAIAVAPGPGSVPPGGAVEY